MQLRAAHVIHLATSCLALTATVSMAVAREFPYRGVINADDVYVRSGPGQDYYPTEKLKRGEVVEVYRHDPGGWYAVRPPASSYSWISARYVREAGDGLLEVTMDGVVARVGSTLNHARDVWQVKLRKGELLEMLDEGASESGAWYRVAPPSGEFRWVYGRYVDPVSGDAELHDEVEPRGATSDFAGGEVQPATAVDRDERNDRNPRLASGGRPISRDRDAQIERAAYQQIPENERPPRDELVNSRRSGTRSLHRAEGGTVHRAASYQAEVSDEESDSTRRTEAPERLARGERRPGVADEPSPPSRVSRGESPARETQAGSISLELERLEAELAFVVAEEADLAQLEDLFDRAVAASDRVRNRQELEQAEKLIERIRRFAALRRQIENAEERLLLTIRRQQQSARAQRSRAADRAISFTRPADEQRSGHDTDAASVELVHSQFDGEGRLVPVYSKRIGAPQYALLDQENRVRAYVTSAPGVNLRAYEGRNVGIIGSRGYSNELKAPHVVAQRVEVLSSTVR